MKSISYLKIILLVLLVGNSTVNSFAQYYILGQDPASVKWNQINTENFKIIFPKGYETNASEYANLLEFSRLAVSEPYLEKTKKFKIVLHNRTVTSNAMVSPTPMHADLF